MQNRKTYSQNTPAVCAGATYRIAEHDSKLHWHDCYEVELVLSGQGTHLINGHTYPLIPGDLYLFTPADCHKVTVDEPVEVLNIMFDDELITEELCTSILALEMTGMDLLTNLSDKKRAVVQHYFRTVIDELNAELSTPMSSTYVGQLLNCIVIELLRKIDNSTSVTPEKQTLKDAILYLHRHYTEPITLTSLATHMHLTSSYLSAYFKTNVGCSFKDYLINLRLRHACRLLVNTEMTATDICYSCGFSSYPHFMRTFRAHYNTSPMQFRQQHQAKKTERIHNYVKETTTTSHDRKCSH